VLNLLSIPGLRPEKVLKLYCEIGVSSLEKLETVLPQVLETQPGAASPLQVDR